MGRINISMMSLEFDLHGLSAAMGAMFDIFEAGILRDFGFVWVNGHGERAWVDDDFFAEDFDREAFHYDGEKGIFKRCDMSGFSDDALQRKVDIVWDQRRGTDILRLVLHGGVPCNETEERIIGVIDREAFPFDYDN